MLAVAAGAKMIEKHVKLGNVEWIHFDKVAIDLNTNEFKAFVEDVRIAEEITGNEAKTVLECEHHKYPVKTQSGEKPLRRSFPSEAVRFVSQTKT